MGGACVDHRASMGGLARPLPGFRALPVRCRASMGGTAGPLQGFDGRALPVRCRASMGGLAGPLQGFDGRPCRSVAGLRWEGIAGPSHGRTISFAPQTPRWGASAPLRGGHCAPPLLQSQAPSVATSLRAVRRSRMRIERAAQLAAGGWFPPTDEAWLLHMERQAVRGSRMRIERAAQLAAGGWFPPTDEAWLLLMER